MFAAAAATGILSLYGTPALADSYAVGGVEDAPGVLSGNNVQAPVHVPVNACGNTVGAVSAFNSAVDGFCANGSQARESGDQASASSRGASPRGASSSGESGGGAQAVGGTEGSPGVLSGNNVQAPVHVPVNACGNDVTAVGAFNEAADSSCANGSQARESGDRSSASRGASSYGNSGGAHAVSDTGGSPGVLSGNNVQAPVHVPLNVCGNTLDLIGLFDSSYGTSCANTTQPGYGTEDVTPPRTVTPAPEPGKRTPPAPPSVDEERPGPGPQLAETGAEGLIVASAASAALITGGAMLYRRRRAGVHR